MYLSNPFKMLVRGVFRHQYVLKFKNVWNSKKSEIIDRGWSQAYFGHCTEIFPFFNYECFPKCSYILSLFQLQVFWELNKHRKSGFLKSVFTSIKWSSSTSIRFWTSLNLFATPFLSSALRTNDSPLSNIPLNIPWHSTYHSYISKLTSHIPFVHIKDTLRTHCRHP